MTGPTLPPRQLDVIRQVANGHSNAETALLLHLTEKTVELYLARAYAKLGVRGRAHAVAVAMSLGLIRPDEIPTPRRNA